MITKHEFWETTPAWLGGDGFESDVVLASRIRFARNLRGVPFPGSASEKALNEVVGRIEHLVAEEAVFEPFQAYRLTDLSQLERVMLLERRVVSPVFSQATSSPAAVVMDRTGRISWMINEEDHLRLQILDAGLKLEYLWEELHSVEQQLDVRLEFAFSDEFGYLTCCPTNAGTGLRVSVLMLLPALSAEGKLEELFNRQTPLPLAVRGFYGEGSDVVGSIFQISNKLTLGWTEFKLVDDLLKMASELVDKELEARERLLESGNIELEDRIYRSLGALQYARILSSREFVEHYANLRLGISLGILSDIDKKTLQELLLWTQPGHLQWQHGKELTALERDVTRAEIVRRRLHL